jgi:predicted component of type VI protein secretion system
MAITLQLPDGVETTLDVDDITIGAEHECDVTLAGDERIRPQHARIFLDADQWVVESLSGGLIQVGDGSPAGDHVLRPGDVIRLGPTGPEIIFQPLAEVDQHASVPAAVLPVETEPVQESTIVEAELVECVAPEETAIIDEPTISEEEPVPVADKAPPPVASKTIASKLAGGAFSIRGPVLSGIESTDLIMNRMTSAARQTGKTLAEWEGQLLVESAPPRSK